MADHTPWEVMHLFIAYGAKTEVRAGGLDANAIGWLCWNRPCRGRRMLYVHEGQLGAEQGHEVQGHHGQFLAMLAQSGVPSSFGIKVDDYEFTIADLVRHEQDTCYVGQELTFKLIGLSHYLDSDSLWANDQKEQWSIARLVEEELSQPIAGAACGGTHRLMGLSYAVRNRALQRKPVSGPWKRAAAYLREYHDYTLRLQNSDGSFSANYFQGRGDWGDVDHRLETHGHILEWLVYSLPHERLRDPQVIRAVDYLATLMLKHQGRRWQIGPRGHALRALNIYHQRAFAEQQPRPPASPAPKVRLANNREKVTEPAAFEHKPRQILWLRQ